MTSRGRLEQDCIVRMDSGGVVVVSQSMYFPWVGLLNQIHLCDNYIYYDDVSYARGFINRVQIKTPHGTKWMTVPLKGSRRGVNIDDCIIDNTINWQKQHIGLIRASLAGAPYCDDVCRMVETVLDVSHNHLGSLNRQCLDALIHMSGINAPKLSHAKSHHIKGASSQRLLGLTKAVNGRVYLSGHGGMRYLDHELFAQNGIDVQYMSYSFRNWKQNHGDFTPFVSSLDALAHLGGDLYKSLNSAGVSWRKALVCQESLRPRQ